MIHRRCPEARAAVALVALASLLFGTACDEEGQAVPSRCADPPLPLFDIAHAGAPADDNARFNDTEPFDPPPCVAEIGHGISEPGTSSDGGTPGEGNTQTGVGGAGAGGA